RAKPRRFCAPAQPTRQTWIFSTSKKEIRRGKSKNNQNPGLAGRVSLWLANGGAGFAGCPLFSTSHLFLSVGFC
ncbi:MAG TPA: hypothetical protein PKC31_03135, partial [Candidatus Nanoperiomorbaceae bacterium]|nr:hypothetical protein [Candidatus Nanoperiomorbaceae bacterium]HMQ97004.1 hypothetical protein [Candidatus Nanoperiomorbaceae bacterium]HMR86420.1 hypothetical protein [Candidatus Nanoperiomorbaceae bacterium]HMU12198.1 hypothetical protein [Candidatus Nanoperiomorbaceae bacterium]